MARSRIAKALVYAEDQQTVEAECRGASWTGGCPRSPPGERVACAGRKLVAMLVGGGEVVLMVEPDAVSCPLAALGLADP